MTKIASDLLREYGLPWEGYDGVKIVSDEITGTSRWSVFHEIIFKWIDGNHYRAEYSVGATEMQDEAPWEYENEVECVEVEQVPVTVLSWVPVKAKEAA